MSPEAPASVLLCVCDLYMKKHFEGSQRHRMIYAVHIPFSIWATQCYNSCTLFSFSQKKCIILLSSGREFKRRLKCRNYQKSDFTSKKSRASSQALNQFWDTLIQPSDTLSAKGLVLWAGLPTIEP